jgi:CheY-like chemotaxis protein
VESDLPTIMVVDDDGFQHKIVRHILKGKGYQLVFARSGIEALNLLHKGRPDLILMDIAIPHMDGLEVTRRVKGVLRFSTIPIIMITGNSEEDIVTQCLKAGAIDFMVKPIGGEALIAKIARVLGAKDTPLSGPPPPELSQSDL